MPCQIDLILLHKSANNRFIVSIAVDENGHFCFHFVYHVSRKPRISLTLLKSQKAFQCTSSLSGQIRIEVILKLGQFRAEVLKNVSNRLLFAPFRDLVLLLFSFYYK